MKKLLFALACACVFSTSTQAVPILEVRFVQDNWWARLRLIPQGFDEPTMARIFVADEPNGSWDTSLIRWNFTFLSISPQGYFSSESKIFSVGEHFPGMEWIDANGDLQRAYGASYTVAQPTGQEGTRTFVPDGGSSGLLMIAGLGLVVAARRVIV